VEPQILNPPLIGLARRLRRRTLRPLRKKRREVLRDRRRRLIIYLLQVDKDTRSFYQAEKGYQRTDLRQSL
jgi:hypothetical protein